MTKNSNAVGASSDAFAMSLDLARALGALIGVLRAADEARSAVSQRDNVRRALRETAAAARYTALELRLLEGELRLGGSLLPPDSPLRDDALDHLVGGLSAHGSSSLDVRRGAAPNELLEVARLLSVLPDVGATDVTWRSWSVRITPLSSPSVPQDAVVLPDAVQHELARLVAARDDATMREVVQALLRLLHTPPWANNAAVLEAVALAMVRNSRLRGARGGRLALEGGLRQLLTTGTLEALVARLPKSTSRDALMPVLARGADVSVAALVRTLQDADTLAERRVCFDAIVALDAGEDALREALRDPRWFMVRNAAALLGEMGVVEADAHLVTLLEHSDERIRIAGARALTRLGTESGLVALQSRLSDPSPEMRRLAASAHGDRGQGKTVVGGAAGGT